MFKNLDTLVKNVHPGDLEWENLNYIKPNERQEETQMKKTVMKNNEKYRNRDCGKGCHRAIDHSTREDLNGEDLELYRFLVGGMQAK